MSLTLLRSSRSSTVLSRFTSISSSTTSASSTFSRNFNSTANSLTATPDWQTTIGGRSGIAKSQALFTSKYQAALASKAKSQGTTIEELMKKNSEELKLKEELLRKERAAKDGVVEAGGVVDGEEGRVVRPLPSAMEEKAAQAKRERNQESSPVKSLNSILDLSKASTLTTSAISNLWTSYHQSKGYLSAAIPTETYVRMMNMAKKYPLFVLPLARDVVGDIPIDGLSKEGGAVEMHLLEWAFLPPPSTVLEPIPSPSTVLFTPLAEYQSRQSYAQPYLILTHYTDLSHSHSLVLMRGEISDNVALNATEAQVLAVRLQLFYNYTGVGGEREKGRLELLESFHERPEEFNLEALVKTAHEL